MSVINEVMKIITFKKILDLKAPCEIIGGWQFGDIWEIDCKEGMVIGSLVEEKDASEAIKEKGKKKDEENTSKKIRFLIPCWSRERIIEKQWLNFFID